MSYESAPATAVEPIYGWPEARPLFGNISRTTAWRMIRAGDLPKPVHISRGRIGWWHRDIVAWQAQRAGADNAPSAAIRAAA